MRLPRSPGLLLLLVAAASFAAVWAGAMSAAGTPAAGAATTPAGAPAPSARAVPLTDTQTCIVPYLAWNGSVRECVVLLPSDYRPNGTEKLPCFIQPHARGVTPRQTAKVWGELPTTERFLVICAGSAGRADPASSWSYPGQIADLMDLPDVVTQSLPWVRIDAGRVYAVGVSMGGMEALSLLARFPDRLAGVICFDGVADLAAYYRSLPASTRVRHQTLLRREVGGPPRRARFRYALRSPLSFADTLATCEVPISIWWSHRDGSVRFQETQQTGKLCRVIRAIRPGAALHEVATGYAHGSALRDDPRRVLSFLRPAGRWLTKPLKAPAEWAYTSWLPDISVWGYRFITESDLGRMWHVTVTSDQVIVRAPAPLTVRIPWTDRRVVTVAIDNVLRQVWPQGGALSLTFPAGESTALIYR
jgi:pimeloyl-ACP methyl ester carboxylesterase